jgi:predicted transcriptional regulator
MDDPEPKSVFDFPLDDEAEARLDAIADAEVDAGLGIPHEEVAAWLKRRAAGENIPPPSR